MIKKNDFVEIDYTGKLKEDEIVFDTTIEKIAKEEGLAAQNSEFKPMTICVGENQIIKGIDESLEGKEIGKEYTIEIEPEKGFGKKSAKLLRMIPAAVFKKQNINPQIGLQVNIDGQVGIIKSASSGRIIVDFNNPLSGKDLVYDIKVNRIVDDTKEKVESIIVPMFGKVDVSVDKDKATIKAPFEIPKEISDSFNQRIIKLVPELKSIEFVNNKDAEKDKKETKHDNNKETKQENKKEESKA